MWRVRASDKSLHPSVHPIYLQSICERRWPFHLRPQDVLGVKHAWAACESATLTVVFFFLYNCLCARREKLPPHLLFISCVLILQPLHFLRPGRNLKRPSGFPGYHGIRGGRDLRHGLSLQCALSGFVCVCAMAVKNSSSKPSGTLTKTWPNLLTFNQQAPSGSRAHEECVYLQKPKYLFPTSDKAKQTLHPAWINPFRHFEVWFTHFVIFFFVADLCKNKNTHEE